jgi:hypothetical protein
MQLRTLSAEDVASVWGEILACAERLRGEPLPDSLRRCQFELGVVDGHHYLAVITSSVADALTGQRHGHLITEALYETLGVRWRVGFDGRTARCSSSILLLRSEIQKVRQTPEMTYYREDPTGVDVQSVETAPNRPSCRLSPPHEEHAAEIAECDNGDAAKSMWIIWRSGVPGSRRLAQPGPCPLLDDDNDPGQLCQGPAGHDGECVPSEMFLPAVAARL